MLTTNYYDKYGKPVIESAEHVEIDGKQYELKIITACSDQARIETHAYGCLHDGFCQHNPEKDFHTIVLRRPGDARFTLYAAYANLHERAMVHIDSVRRLMRQHYAGKVS